MSALDHLGSLLIAGIGGLVNYLSAHVLLCLVPAFFIAGALSALFSKESVTKYLGKDTPAYISYPIASVAGLLIAVCSCTILPLFAGIWKKGAGLGPAVTFLFTGPAVNLLAIAYTGSLIGWDIAFARAVLSVLFGITIGILMMLIFERAGFHLGIGTRVRKEKPSLNSGAWAAEETPPDHRVQGPVERHPSYQGGSKTQQQNVPDMWEDTGFPNGHPVRMRVRMAYGQAHQRQHQPAADSHLEWDGRGLTVQPRRVPA